MYSNQHTKSSLVISFYVFVKESISRCKRRSAEISNPDWRRRLFLDQDGSARQKKKIKSLKLKSTDSSNAKIDQLKRDFESCGVSWGIRDRSIAHQ